ncbi:MAG: hypothetical protein QM811_08155 [Pirellulales bacterium]
MIGLIASLGVVGIGASSDAFRAISEVYTAAGGAKPRIDSNFEPRETDDEREDRVLTALDRPTMLAFDGWTLSQLLERLRDEYGIVAAIDRAACEETVLDGSTKLAFRANDRPLRHALRVCLTKVGLDYRIEHGLMVVTSPEQVEAATSLRIYEIDDLVAAEGAAFDGDRFLSMLVGHCEKTSWSEYGGPGNCALIRNRTLVVTNRERTHDAVRDLLARLRAANASAPVGPPHDDELVRRVYRVWTSETVDLTVWPTLRPITSSIRLPAHHEASSSCIVNPPKRVPAPRRVVAPPEELATLVTKLILPTSRRADGPTIQAGQGVVIVRHTRAGQREVERFLYQLGVLFPESYQPAAPPIPVVGRRDHNVEKSMRH